MSFSIMLADQARFCSNFFFPPDLTVEDREKWTKEFIQQLVAETTEVLGEINWKHHKLTRKPVDRQKLLGELVDCQKFLTNLFHVWGFTHSDIMMEWSRKTAEVERRFREEKATEKPLSRLTKEQWIERSNEQACDLHDLKTKHENLEMAYGELSSENEQLQRDIEALRMEFDNVR